MPQFGKLGAPAQLKEGGDFGPLVGGEKGLNNAGASCEKKGLGII